MKPANEEVTLYDENPSMFRNRPVEFVFTVVLCVVLVGFIIFFMWWLRCKGTQLTITSEPLGCEKGFCQSRLLKFGTKMSGMCS